MKKKERKNSLTKNSKYKNYKKKKNNSNEKIYNLKKKKTPDETFN